MLPSLSVNQVTHCSTGTVLAVERGASMIEGAQPPDKRRHSSPGVMLMFTRMAVLTALLVAGRTSAADFALPVCRAQSRGRGEDAALTRKRRCT